MMRQPRFFLVALSCAGAMTFLLVASLTGSSARLVRQAVPARNAAGESDAALTSAVRGEAEKLAGDGKFSGVMLVAREEKPILEAAYGMADRENHVPNRTDMKFNLASVGKMFTGVAIAQLAAAGKLQFSDPVAKFLPDYPNHDFAASATLDELLTDTSGLGDFFGPQYFDKKDTLKQLSDYLPLFANQPVRFKPGAGWAYSNAGYIILGLVIEKVSGESYYDYVREKIFAPAGMTASGYYGKADTALNLAIGYLGLAPDGRPLAEPRPNTEMLPPRGTSAGGGYSTAGDLLRFVNALESHKLLDASYTELVLKPRITSPQGVKFGYGFGTMTRSEHTVVGFIGGSPGVNTEVDMYRDSGYTVIVLANVDPPAASHLAGFISGKIPK